jgi:hypothetical protein
LLKNSAYGQQVSLATKVNICDTSNRLHKEYIADVDACKKTKPVSVRHCSGQIFNTISSTLDIDAIRCYIIKTGYETINYFLALQLKSYLTL